MSQRPQSQALYKQLCDVIPGGVNSPVRACMGVNQLPIVIDSACADTITDADGHTYIDYCGSWGPLIHGHAHPDIVAAAQKRVAMGTTFGITSTIEGELAAKVVSLIDSVEKIRFVSSGTEATMSAIRLARGYTGRNIIIKFDGNYHGHADFFLVNAGSGVLSLNSSSSAGIPPEIVKHTISLPFNDLDACRAILLDPAYSQQIAAVILEPIAANMGVVPADKEFLQALRTATNEIGALLIFDEVISGFRVGLGGAQELYGIRPDLTCFGKIIGGGFPAAAFGGQRDIMDHLAPLGPVYQAGTLSGNPVAMAAGLTALNLLEEKDFYTKLDINTRFLTDPIEQYLADNQHINACLQRVGSIFTLFFGCRQIRNMADAKKANADTFGSFFRYMFANGVYIPPLQWEAWFVSSAHTPEHLTKTSELVIAFLKNNTRTAF